MLPRRLGVALLLVALFALPVPSAGHAAASARLSYTWSATPSPVVLKLADRNVRLQPTSYCWQGPVEQVDGGEISTSVCAQGRQPSARDLVTVTRHGAIRFWFGRPGWRWSARLTSLAHPRRAACTVRRTPTAVAPRQFDIKAPRFRGKYRVLLVGHGPEGEMTVSFAWKYGKRPGRCF